MGGMSTAPSAESAEIFKARTNKWFAGLAWAVAGAGLVSTALSGQAEAVSGTGPLLLTAYLGWVLFWRPSVVVEEAGVRLENPFRSIAVPWAALVQVDTRYALTLITPARSYGAWAAPAPGIWGGRNARPEDLQGLPGSTYGPGRSVRPGDLKSTDSGQAAQLVRARWQQMVESGALDAGAAADTPVAVRVRWLELGVTAALVLFSIWGVALL
jgi:hypothetical protein